MKKSLWFVSSVVTAAISFVAPVTAFACPYGYETGYNNTYSYHCDCQPYQTWRPVYRAYWQPSWRQQYWNQPTYNYRYYDYANYNYGNSNYYPNYNYGNSYNQNYYRSW